MARCITNPADQVNTASRHRRLLFALIAVLGTVLWGGCSVEKHYELLSFFFDGVPDPNAPAAESRALAGGALASDAVVLSMHTAYEERRCYVCHGETSNFGFVVSGFSQLDSTTCMKCHGDVTTAYPVMHGPVAAQECLWCHHAHASTQPKLLTANTPGLCLQCHSFGLMGSPAIPEHMDLQRDCLDCHHGHGGTDLNLLRSVIIESTNQGDVDAPAVEPEEASER